MWRPKDWKRMSPKPDGYQDELYCDIGENNRQQFERGAQAMLKALIRWLEEDCTECPGFHHTNRECPKWKGKLVRRSSLVGSGRLS
jgi:hypothetical protein